MHFPYAAGFLLVGADIASLSNQMYHIHITADYGELLNFKEKSDNIMHLFNKELKDTIRCNKGVSIVYFHNLSRGIILLKFYVHLGYPYRVKPLIRDNNIYEIIVYLNEKVFIRFRDSLKLLPASLDSLGATL